MEPKEKMLVIDAARKVVAVTSISTGEISCHLGNDKMRGELFKKFVLRSGERK